MKHFLTIRCSGTWYHGQEGAYNKRSGAIPAGRMDEQPRLKAYNKNKFAGFAYALCMRHRTIVLSALLSVCIKKSWTLYAAHVLRDHFHCLVGAPVDGETISKTLKTAATIALKNAKIDAPTRKDRWTPGFWDEIVEDAETFRDKLIYIIHGQGEPRAVYQSEATFDLLPANQPWPPMD